MYVELQTFNRKTYGGLKLIMLLSTYLPAKKRGPALKSRLRQISYYFGILRFLGD